MPMLRMSSGIRACCPTSEAGGSIPEMFSVPAKFAGETSDWNKRVHAQCQPSGKTVFKRIIARMGDSSLPFGIDRSLLRLDSQDPYFCLLGKGDGTFTGPQDYLVGAQANSLAVGDFNGDGAPDVAAGDQGENFVTILLNQTLPPVSITPKSLTFVDQLVGTSSATQAITVTNNGAAATTITIAASGDFAQTNTCPVSPATLAAAANCTINVAFKPTATGLRNGTITITHNLAGSPHTLALSGTGVAPVVSLGTTTSISFGNQLVGSSSAGQNVTLSNTGTATLTISSIAITGTNSGDYSQTNTCGSSVAAGANCSISVTFKPTATGSRTASVSLTDNAAGSPQSISLTGTGVVAAVTLSPLTLTFTGQLITTASAPQTVMLTNSGTAPLTISSIAISGTSSGDFSETNTCPAPAATLATGANCTISVMFKPTTTGNRVASVTVTDSASGGPQSVSLTGAGTDYSLAAATGANCPVNGNCSTSATISAGQTATYDLQVTPASGFNGTVAFTCTGAPAPSACAVSPTSAPPNGSSSYAFVVTVNNTANALMPTSPVFPRTPWMPWMRFVLSLLSMIMTSLLVRKFFAAVRPVRMLVPVAAALFFSLVYASGCGGGGGGPVVKPPTNATLTITGSSGTVNRTLNLSLTVSH